MSCAPYPPPTATTCRSMTIPHSSPGPPTLSPHAHHLASTGFPIAWFLLIAAIAIVLGILCEAPTIWRWAQDRYRSRYERRYRRQLRRVNTEGKHRR